MLTTYINNFPSPKFILIQDSLENRACNFLKYIIDKHKETNQIEIHYFVFEGRFLKTCNENVHPLMTYYDFTIDSLKLDEKLKGITKNSVVVIDSLAHLLYFCSGKFIFNLLNGIINKNEILQLIGIFHKDLIKESTALSSRLEYLATLSINIFKSTSMYEGRLLYTYKKQGGKIIRQLEEYKFKDSKLFSEPLKKPDVKGILLGNANEILPENLSTFKISLEDEERSQKDKVVLPYLPRENEGGSGNIIYDLEEADDWDEEDPDDDLDF